jgi:hypothetical protein
MRRYAGRDRVMCALIEELSDQAVQLDRAMPVPLLKEVHFTSHAMARSRDMSGRAMRNR